MKKLLVACAVSAAVSMFASFAVASQIPGIYRIELKQNESEWQECHNLYFDFEQQVAYCSPPDESWAEHASREDVLKNTSPMPFSQIREYLITDSKRYVFYFSTSKTEDAEGILQHFRSKVARTTGS